MAMQEDNRVNTPRNVGPSASQCRQGTQGTWERAVRTLGDRTHVRSVQTSSKETLAPQTLKCYQLEHLSKQQHQSQHVPAGAPSFAAPGNCG